MRSTLPLVICALGACSSGSGGDPDAAPSDGRDGGDPPATCVTPVADRAGTARWTDALGQATVEIADAAACARRYTLATTAPRRDDLPANPRVIDELPGAPTVRTGHDLFDALYALALAEVREASVDAISDGAFNGGAPLPCPAGGCFETGRLWKYVWTRDVSYAVDLGLAALDPQRARNSLEFKLSALRAGGAEQIVQDTGTGGSYPVSSDRVVWALGADALLPYLTGAARTAFADRAFAAIAATVEHDRGVVFDAVDGLYFGEQSFLDWREQSYADWTATAPAAIASSKALGTNVVHLRALEIAAALAEAHGDAAARDRYAGWATALRDRIRARFWDEAAGQFATFAPTFLDPAPARRWDLLGASLAIVSGVATDAQADRMLSSYPHLGPGAAPVIFPEQQLTPIYHNRAEWPFVTAYWLRAAAAAGHDAAADRALLALVRGAALNLSNMENLETVSGAPWVDDGAASGPVVNSQRQLWSVAGYLSMVHHTLFGLRPGVDGLRLTPYLTRGLRNGLFAGTSELALNDLPWHGHAVTVVLHLPPVGGAGGSYAVGEVRVDGAVVTGPITDDRLGARSRVDVTLLDPGPVAATSITVRGAADWRDVFGPRTPRITAVTRVGASLALGLDVGGEDPATIRLSVYRDGARVATDLLGTTTSYTDATATVTTSPCYTIEACFTGSGNCSQHAAPMCWWGDGGAAIASYGAGQLTAVGGALAATNGRPHWGDWGDPGHTLQVTVTATRTGAHLLQLVYANGAGGLTTGITCAVKRIVVEDVGTGAVVGDGVVIMPQLGAWDRWGDSTFVPAELQAGRAYRVTVRGDAGTVNMSAFAHFARYTGGTGGAGGEFARVDIAELKLLAR
ncbi:MAG: hypothetical protein IPL61_33690 [Myxococcales bacterium]|nr:hypothetical protein [Myxococcales bacterium]